MAILDVPHHGPPPSHAADELDHDGYRLHRHGKEDHGDQDQEAEDDVDVLNKGVRHLCERAGAGGVTSLPERYVLPPSQRPAPGRGLSTAAAWRLPVVDLARLRGNDGGGDRAAALGELDAACREYGFFQVVNHGVPDAGAALDMARRFFDLPSAARARWMSSDIRAPVRYGTSFNQRNDGVRCWRDFLKLVCDDIDGVVGSWPDNPADLREVVSAYARASQRLFRELMEAALDALLGTTTTAAAATKAAMLAGCAAGSQMLIANCFPPCPEPDLTLGMPPHSDYGLLTVLLQDQVRGLEVRDRAGRWLLVDPLPGALLVNVGDYLEIFSNGRYRSVLHRVRVNAERPRISVASLHSLPPEAVVAPAPELVDGGENPRRYMDTDFAAFLSYIAAAEGCHKSFLDSRRIPHPQ